MALTSNTSNIPFFSPNQVLRADDLNALVDYVVEQARLTRRFTVGIGIFNGLTIELMCNGNVPQSITIDPGTGISSDGFLFSINEACTFDGFRAVGSGEGLYQCAKVIDKNLEVAPPLPPGAAPSIVVEEIYELGNTQDANFDSLSTFNDDDRPRNIEDYAVALVRCQTTVERGRCFSDCEAPGSDTTTRISALLVPCEWLEEEEGNGTEPDDPVKVSFSEQPVICRFGFDDDDSIDLNSIEDWPTFYQKYRALCDDDTRNSINGAYNQAYSMFHKKLNPDSQANPFTGLAGRLDQLFPEFGNIQHADAEKTYFIQYLYSYLRDLVIAFYEFEKAACGLSIIAADESGNGPGDTPTGADNAFPGYLILGKLSCEGVDSGGRTGVFPAAIKQAADERQLLAECLYARLEALSNMSNLLFPAFGGTSPVPGSIDNTIFRNSPDRLRITPGWIERNSLNQRAVPYYFSSALIGRWNCLNPLCEQIRGRAHQYVPYDEEHPLLKDLGEYNFFRIEGHIGRELHNTMEGIIQDRRKRLNIPFDMRAVRLGAELVFELEDFSDDDKSIFFGETQELYANTRADLLCALIDFFALPNVSESSFPNTLELKRKLEEEAVFLHSFDITTFYLCFDEAVAELNNFEALKTCILEAKIIISELRNKYDTVSEALKKSTSFNGFAKEHSGMEHLGGVPKGGTFVLVYVFRFLDPVRKAPFLAAVGGGDLTDDEVIVKFFEENDSSLTVDNLRDATQKIIVADFCLPYLCCSQTPVIRNEIKQVERPTIDLTSVDCFDPAESPGQGPEVSIVATPPDETLRLFVNGAELDEAATPELDADGVGVLALSVNDFDAGKITVQGIYSIEGGIFSAEDVVTIYKMPDTAFTADYIGLTEDGTALRFEFSADNLLDGDYTEANWVLPDGSSIPYDPANQPQEVSIPLSQAGSLILSLQVVNGACQPTPVSLDLCTLITPELNLRHLCTPAINSGPPPAVTNIECANGLQPDAVGSNVHTLTVGGDTGEIGLIELEPTPPGGQFSIFLLNPPDGGGEQALGDSLIVSVSIPGSGETKTFFIYDPVAVEADSVLWEFLGQPSLPAGIVLPAAPNFRIEYSFGACGATTTVELQIEIPLTIELASEDCFTPVKGSNAGPSVGIMATPPGKTLTLFVNGNQLDAADTPGLDAAGAGTLNLNVDDFDDGQVTVRGVYSEGGSSAEQTINIYKMPEPDFSATYEGTEPDPNTGEPMAVFELNNNLSTIDYTAAEWRFPDQGNIAVPGINPPGTQPVSISLPLAEELPLSLRVENGACEKTVLYDLCAFITMTLGLRHRCAIIEIQNPPAPPSSDISCNILPDISGSIYALTADDDEIGLVELRATPVGGEFRAILLDNAPGGTDRDVSGLIVTMEDQNQDPPVTRTFFVYDPVLVSGNTELMSLLDQEPTLPAGVVLPAGPLFRIEYSLGLCQANVEMILQIVPSVARQEEPKEEESKTTGQPAEASAGQPTQAPVEKVKKEASKASPKTKAAPVVAPVTAESRKLLKERLDSYQKKLGQQKEALGNASGLRLAALFLPTQGQAEKLAAEYREAAQSLLRGMRPAGDKKKAKYRTVLIALTLSYLDKLAIMPGELPQPAVDALTEVLSKMAKAGLNLATLRRQWKAAQLKRVLDTEKVEALNKLLKP